MPFQIRHFECESKYSFASAQPNDDQPNRNNNNERDVAEQKTT